ncbi:SDR family NAD(P)-dependent oxidoreductase [Acidocella sp. MX-AZ03]|uniref:SDR family NAD(P)-dependent oxidoreductase n=1 Tax=Acidocella sp. MX-AZ03 TaxID=2697363 RepID=UPI0022DCECD0|nr:SDR family NAD(P)-dependent oxidoreductase [Acidocella sp. MX-AZ03]WBO60989.1 SDR family NAD(P)-dependent oxidoreductase [Acidocella sp. MX-AZ03]
MEQTFNISEFTGKVAIVTGAASGIGRATVELLHARGARVIAEDRDEKVNELARDGIVPLIADVTEETAAQQAVELAIGQFGKLDILINNAGIIINKLVMEMTLEDWDRIFAVNIRAAWGERPASQLSRTSMSLCGCANSCGVHGHNHAPRGEPACR